MFAYNVCTYCLRCVPHVAHCSKRIQKDGSRIRTMFVDALHCLTFLSASRDRPGTRGESAEPEPVYTVDFDQDGSFTKITKLAQSFYLRRNSKNSLGTWLQHAIAMLPVMVGC